MLFKNLKEKEISKKDLDKVIVELETNQSKLNSHLNQDPEVPALKTEQHQLMINLKDGIKELIELPPKPDWMYDPWAHDHEIVNFINPYHSTKEFLYWFIKKAFGPTRCNRAGLTYMKKNINPLNVISGPTMIVGFVGDIMEMRHYELEFDERIKEFFKGVDLVVGNFEGTLTIQPEYVMAQRHNIEIMEQLTKGLNLKPEQWLLCLSNNHSGDFGLADYCFSLDRLRWAGFNVFGRRDIPNFILEKEGIDFKMNFVSGTVWRNQESCTYQTLFKCRDQYFEEGPHDVFNVLYPHWNYENELYPRKKCVALEEPLMKKWDLIFGAHTHVPQPIMEIKHEGISKILAYCGGNFTSGWEVPEHNCGLIMKCEVGKLNENTQRLAVGNVQWEFTYAVRKKENKKKIKFKEHMLMPRKEDKPVMITKWCDHCPINKKIKEQSRPK